MRNNRLTNKDTVEMFEEVLRTLSLKEKSFLNKLANGIGIINCNSQERDLVFVYAKTHLFRVNMEFAFNLFKDDDLAKEEFNQNIYNSIDEIFNNLDESIDERIDKVYPEVFKTFDLPQDYMLSDDYLNEFIEELETE